MPVQIKEKCILQIYHYFITLSLNNATLARKNSVALYNNAT